MVFVRDLGSGIAKVHLGRVAFDKGPRGHGQAGGGVDAFRLARGHYFGSERTSARSFFDNVSWPARSQSGGSQEGEAGFNNSYTTSLLHMDVIKGILKRKKRWTKLESEGERGLPGLWGCSPCLLSNALGLWVLTATGMPLRNGNGGCC
jgi:hypothetical protein